MALYTEVASQRASTGNNNGVDSANLAFPNNVTSGNLLIVTGGVWGSSAAPTSITVTDTRSTSYTVVLGDIPAGLTWRTFIAYGNAGGSGACTVTVDPLGASHSLSFSVDEFTGADSSPSDVAGGTSQGNVNGSAFTASDSITTVAADALIIGVMSHEVDTRTLTAGTNYTTIGENETNANNQCHHAVFRIVTTAQAYTVSIDGGAGGASGTPGWALQTHSFKPATSSTTTLTPAKASLTITGQAPRLKLTVPVAKASLSITGFAPPLKRTVPVPKASLTLTGYVSSLRLRVPVPKASLVLTGFAPGIQIAFAVPVPKATLSITGLAPSLKLTIAAPKGTLTITGRTPSLKFTFPVPKGTLTLTGRAPALKLTLPAAKGTLTLTSFIPTVSATEEILFLPAKGTLTLTGFIPTVTGPEVQADDSIHRLFREGAADTDGELFAAPPSAAGGEILRGAPSPAGSSLFGTAGSSSSSSLWR